MTQDELLMRTAACTASFSSKRDIGGPFGAIIVDENEQIIASGVNTVLSDLDPTCHAEMNAIRKAAKVKGSYDLSGCKIYATGFPCPMCLGAIIWAGIKHVYYGTSIKEANDIGFRDENMYGKLADLANSGISFEQVGHQACLELFTKYQKRQGTIY